MHKRILILLTAGLLCGATAFAGSFTNSLGSASNQTGFTLNTALDPTGNTYPIITDGYLLMTYNEGSLGGISMVLNDLDNGKAIDSFMVTFNLMFGPGSSPPADGFAFAFGPNINSSTTFGEEGPGGSALTVEFDTYRNLDESPWDSIGIDIKVTGPEIACHPFNYASTLVDSVMHPVTIQLNKNGTLNMTWDGQIMYTNLILTGWAPTQGQFAFGARTGGDEQLCAIQDLGITTTVAPTTTSAPTITTPPQSVTMAEGAPVAFTVDCESDAPLTIQWAQNGVGIDGATNWVFIIPRVDYALNGAKYTCTITGSAGSVTSSAATLTVTPTTAPPNVLSANIVANGSSAQVGIQFDKGLDPTSATTLANYSIPGGTITAATYYTNIPREVLTLGSMYDPINALVNNNLVLGPTNSGVVLTVNGLTQGTNYTVTVSNLANGNGNKMATPQTAGFYFQVTYPLSDQDVGSPTLAGSLHTVIDPFAGCAHYTVVGGGDDIWNTSSDFHFAYAKITGDFDIMVQVTSLVGPDQYSKAELMCDGFTPASGLQGSDPFVSGVFTQEGNEVNNDLELQWRPTPGVDAQSSGMTPAVVPTYPNTWLRLTRVGSNFTLMEGPDGINWTSSATYNDTTNAFGTTTAVGLAVTAHYDSDPVGGIATFDHFGLPIPIPIAITGQPVATEALSGNTMAHLIGVPTSITLQPGQAVTNVEGFTVTLSVTATGSPLNYQWMLNGTPIAGAPNSSTLTLANATPSQSGTYTVKVYNAAYSVTSSGISVTIIPDTTPPVILAGSALMNHQGSYDIGLIFNKALDPTSAATAANYSLSTGKVLAANLITNSPGVIVTATNLGAGSNVTITVKNVADTLGNKISSANFQFVVSKMAWGEVGAEGMASDPTDFAGPANYVGGFPAGYGVVAVATNAFDLYSDGWAEWDNYDETTFVYEPITGDFDKKLQVVYQDNSSEWARAGLIMREDLSTIGMDSLTQTGNGVEGPANANPSTGPFTGLAGRYQKIHANPVGETLTDAAGNASWETNRRLWVGSGCSADNYNQDGGASGAAYPLYPNVWCRLQRQWSTNFSYFRSDDGQNWVWMGTTVWSDNSNALVNASPAMPATVYVGPEFSPEVGNYASDEQNLRGRCLAQMRNYGDTWASVPPVASRAYSIGLKFGSDLKPNGYPTALAASAVAGIPGIQQANWNNLVGASGSTNKVTADQAGTAVATTAAVTWSSPNLWATLGESGESNNIWNGEDSVLMTAYLDTASSGTTTVTMTDIPTALTSGGYDVYVYACGSVGTRGGAYRIVDAASGDVLKDYVYATTAWFAPTYVPVPSNTSPTNYGAGNYIVFKGLTSSGITIQASTANNLGVTVGRGLGVTPRTPINAVQLVSPTSAVVSAAPTLSIKWTPPNVTITFTGTLQSASTLTGTWADVPSATSPYVVPATGAKMFYRASSSP
jgi:hypothetical protein